MPTRRLILITPVLLMAGIVVQVIALVLVVLLWVPCLIWPGILNGPYRWITQMGAKFMARTIVGRVKSRRVGVLVPPHADPT
jgi:hypothetical protein